MSVMPKRIAERPGRSVKALYSRLFSFFGPQKWWPADTAWEMMVGAILVQNTAWTNAEKAISELKKAHALSPRALAHMPQARLEAMVRSSGYFRQKAKKLKALGRVFDRDAAFYRQVRGKAPADFTTLRRRLLALHGIGPETADCILLYAGAYPVFVVDAYTRRMGLRVGILTVEGYNEVQAYFMSHLPRDPKLFQEFHALIVQHGKEFCTKRTPLCLKCPLVSVCDYGRSHTRRKR